MWPIISIIQVLTLKSPDRLSALREFGNSYLLDWEEWLPFWNQ